MRQQVLFRLLSERFWSLLLQSGDMPGSDESGAKRIHEHMAHSYLRCGRIRAVGNVYVACKVL